MTRHRTLRFEIKNFGPILSGSFRLHPLTIFLGPNSSGKSYAARLVYSILRTLRGGIGKRLVFGPSDRPIPSSSHELHRIIEQAISSRVLDHLITSFDCEKLSDLISWFAPKQSAQVDVYIEASEHPLIHIVGKRDGWTVETQLEQARVPGEAREYEFSPLSLNAMWHRLMDDIGLPGAAFYLPAARSGVLQAMRGLLSRAIAQMSRGDLVAEVPSFPGIIGEFISELIYMSAKIARASRPGPSGGHEESPEDFRKIIQVLEKEAFRGSVDFMPGQLPLREIGFETRWKGRKLAMPVRRASSSILETASLILWVKHLLEPGDVLIVEEPEAHLHPENERRIARVLVRLVRSGVTVICTTNSPMILHQISNHILAAQVPPGGRASFTEQDLLYEGEVGVYLFRPRRKGRGSEIRFVPVAPGFGIPEDEFVRVAEEINRETNRLIRSSLRED